MRIEKLKDPGKRVRIPRIPETGLERLTRSLHSTCEKECQSYAMRVTRAGSPFFLQRFKEGSN